jgi:hypothetical protein
MNQATASTTQRFFAAATIAAGGAAVFVVGYFNPTTAGFFPVCPLYSLTGLACPGCGMTRGFHALLHGDISSALGYNLLLPAILFFFGYLFMSLFLTVARGRGLSFKLFNPTVVWSFFAVALVFSVVRNLPFYPFSILYP